MSGSNNVRKVSELPTTNSAASDDRLVILKNPGGSPSTRTISVENLFSNSSANVVLQKQTPANSTITVAEGTLFFDETYLYVAVANNVLKRVELSSF
jgi:hypothetical protein